MQALRWLYSSALGCELDWRGPERKPCPEHIAALADRASEHHTGASTHRFFPEHPTGECVEMHLLVPHHGVDKRPPVVVVLNGLALQCDFSGVPEVVNTALDNGCACAVFDYRHFGASDGIPRHHVNCRRQKEDARLVVRFLQSDSIASQLVDSTRVALHGVSNGGGYALQMSAECDTLGISAIVATVPRLNTPVSTVLLRSVREPTIVVAFIRLLAIIMLDALLACFLARQRAKHGMPYLYVPVRDAPGRPAPIQAPSSLVNKAVPPKPRGGWCNKLSAASLRNLMSSEPPSKVAMVSRVPVLLIGAKEDKTCPMKPMIELAERAEKVQFVSVPGEHLDIFKPYFPHDTHAAFLSEHLHK